MIQGMSQAMSQAMKIYRELVYWTMILTVMLKIITKKQLTTNTLTMNNPLRNIHRFMAINTPHTQVHGNQQQTQDLDNVDVKPPVLAKFRFAQEIIEISSDSDNGDVPDKQENELEADNDDCILDRVVPPKFECITHERNYGCYVCLQAFEMQQSFVIHFQNQHPELPFRCEFCSSDFQSPNGLFKHECSHEYLKYKCIACNKKFQFPYKLKAHKSTHTGLDRHKCGLCE